jgi:amino acid permease
LNIYAETDKPQKFFTYATIIIIVLTLGVAVSVGYVGYLAFGNNQRSLLLYNLPNEDPWAITVELCYVVTMAGSFVLVI